MLMKSPLLLQLEEMIATDTIIEALQIRGFLVKKEDDFIVLQEGSGKRDAWGLRRLLQRLNIPTLWNDKGNRVQILVNTIPFSMAQKIIHTRGRNHPFYIKDYQMMWRHFANKRYGLKTNTLDLDPNIAMLVKTLNLAGITAITGCDGHEEFAPHIRLSGPFNGVWLKIIQERLFQKLELHYNWSVELKGMTGAQFIAKKGINQTWDQKKILRDTSRMASILAEHAVELRYSKKASFKRSEMMKDIANSFVENVQYEELQKWMESLVSK